MMEFSLSYVCQLAKIMKTIEDRVYCLRPTNINCRHDIFNILDLEFGIIFDVSHKWLIFGNCCIPSNLYLNFLRYNCHFIINFTLSKILI